MGRWGRGGELGDIAHLRKWPLTPGKPVSCPDKKDETEKKGVGVGVGCVCQYSISYTKTQSLSLKSAVGLGGRQPSAKRIFQTGSAAR